MAHDWIRKIFIRAELSLESLVGARNNPALLWRDTRSRVRPYAPREAGPLCRELPHYPPSGGTLKLLEFIYESSNY